MALAKFWDDDVKKPMPLSQFVRADVARVIKYLVPVLQTAVVALMIERVTTNVIAAGYSCTGKFDEQGKILGFEVKPKKDAKGLNVVTGQWSCDQAYNDFVKIISADEHYADLKLSSCEWKGCAEKWIKADHAAAAVCTKGSSLIAEDDPEYYVRI
jgi:hypothetical protein